MQLFLELFGDLELLGEGGQAKVYKSIEKQSGLLFALKIYKTSFSVQDKNKKLIRREFEIMHALNYQYIVKVYELLEDQDDFVIKMEFIDGMSLDSVLKLQFGGMYDDIYELLNTDDELIASLMKSHALQRYQRVLRRQYVPLTEAMEFKPMEGFSLLYNTYDTFVEVVAWQLILLLEFLSSKNIIHRDLKPGNILFSKNGQLKLIDFGFAIYQDGNCKKTFAGTRGYKAPEMFYKKEYDKSADIWSFGCVVFELCCGYPPFADVKDPMFMNFQYDNMFVMPEDLCVKTSMHWLIYLVKLVLVERNKRPTIEEIIITFQAMKTAPKLRYKRCRDIAELTDPTESSQII